MRLLTIHNLAYLQRLMAELRDAIDEGRLRRGRRRGARAAPWELAAPCAQLALRDAASRLVQGLRPAGAPAPAPTTR